MAVLFNFGFANCVPQQEIQNYTSIHYILFVPTTGGQLVHTRMLSNNYYFVL